MRRITVPAIASALALVAGLAVAAPAAAAPPAPLFTAAKVITKEKVDVDGDGVKDSVTVSRVATEKYKIAVKTAAGESSSLTVASNIYERYGVSPLAAAAELDGEKGYELIFGLFKRDIRGWYVLTWRDGEIVRERAPAPRPSSDEFMWRTGSTGPITRGYTFYTTEGGRYVRVSRDGWGGAMYYKIRAISKWDASQGWVKGGVYTVGRDWPFPRVPTGFRGVELTKLN